MNNCVVHSASFKNYLQFHLKPFEAVMTDAFAIQSQFSVFVLGFIPESFKGLSIGFDEHRCGGLQGYMLSPKPLFTRNFTWVRFILMVEGEGPARVRCSKVNGGYQKLGFISPTLS